MTQRELTYEIDVDDTFLDYYLEVMNENIGVSGIRIWLFCNMRETWIIAAKVWLCYTKVINFHPSPQSYLPVTLQCPFTLTLSGFRDLLWQIDYWPVTRLAEALKRGFRVPACALTFCQSYEMSIFKIALWFQEGRRETHGTELRYLSYSPT